MKRTKSFIQATKKTQNVENQVQKERDVQFMPVYMGIGSLDISLFGTPNFWVLVKVPFPQKKHKYKDIFVSERHRDSQSYKKQISIDENKSSTN